jgi:hypothetical protein
MRDVKSLHRPVFSADRAVHAALGGALALGLTACDPTVFDELADDTGVRVAEVPGGYARAGFGGVVATYVGRVGDVPVTRLAASAGADSQIRVYTGWTGETIALEPAAFDTCLEATDCERGSGASLTGLPRWRDQPLCVAFGAPAASAVLLRCEGVALGTTERLRGPADSRFGEAIAALPGERLLVGAPFGAGNVFVVDAARGARTIATALEAARADGVAEFGAALAAGARADGSALAAIAAPSGALRRVAVVSLDPMGEATLAACLEDAAGPFGDVLAVGDVVGDDTPDVVVGDDPASVLRREEVRVYDGAALLAAGGACPALVEPAVIACVDHRGVACAGSGFGTSLAMGDVDGDGDGDLAIGAPEATVEGEAQAGAVWLVPGNGDALEASGADVLTASTPEVSARLGASVAMLATRARSEVVAGAPGSAEVYVFGCSGLAGDGPSIGPRCIPAR